MLTAVAIIAALMGVATFVARTGIQSANQANCLANLRQIGGGLELYLQDHHQRLPTLVSARSSRQDPQPALETVIIDYLESETVFRCPADPESWQETGSSYMWNLTQNGKHISELSFFFTEDPTRIPLVVDKEAWHAKGKSKSANFLYADHSAENRLRLTTN